MTDISLHGPQALRPQFAATGENSPASPAAHLSAQQQQASCPNLRVACADGSTFIPKGTNLDALFGNNNGPV